MAVSMNAQAGPRVEALQRYRVLDTPAEKEFDDLAELASYICGTPIAIVTLLDGQRQWFKAKIGLGASETPIEQAFCAHAVQTPGEVMMVKDARVDSRFATNPLVTSDPHIRFYAGAPLVTPEGVALGTLCAIDRVPRELSLGQQKALQVLARQVVAHLELRRTVSELMAALEQKQAALAEVEALTSLLPICAYCKKIRDDADYWQHVDKYIATRSDIRFSHGICPDCYAAFFQEQQS